MAGTWWPAEQALRCTLPCCSRPHSGAAPPCNSRAGGGRRRDRRCLPAGCLLPGLPPMPARPVALPGRRLAPKRPATPLLSKFLTWAGLAGARLLLNPFSVCSRALAGRGAAQGAGKAAGCCALSASGALRGALARCELSTCRPKSTWLTSVNRASGIFNVCARFSFWCCACCAHGFNLPTLARAAQAHPQLRVPTRMRSAATGGALGHPSFRGGCHPNPVGTLPCSARGGMRRATLASAVVCGLPRRQLGRPQPNRIPTAATSGTRGLAAAAAHFAHRHAQFGVITRISGVRGARTIGGSR